MQCTEITLVRRVWRYQREVIRRVWRYQREVIRIWKIEGQTKQWPKEKVQKNKQRSTT